MTPAEAAVLLTAISAYDGREVTAENAQAWALTLRDVPLQDAMEWLPSFYEQRPSFGKPTVWPYDVVEGVETLQRHRLWQAGHDAYFAELEGKEHTPDNRQLALEAAKAAKARAASSCQLALTAGSER